MKTFVTLLIAVSFSVSCRNSTDKKSSAQDTNIVIPTAVDTDDHNKGATSSIALDSAGQTIYPKDTNYPIRKPPQ